MSVDTLSDVEGSSEGALQYQDEVAAYIDYKTPMEDSFDVLSWWGEHSYSFPIIAQTARFILAIPAPSAASERDFCAGYVIQVRRSQLKPSTVDGVLFFPQQSKTPRQTPDIVIPRRKVSQNCPHLIEDD